jgi:hypothetical protein
MLAINDSNYGNGARNNLGKDFPTDHDFLEVGVDKCRLLGSK